MTNRSGPVRVARTAVGSGAVLSLGAALVGPVAPAGAATFTVTNNSNAGAGSLRQAVLDANAAPGDDEITFAPGLGTITLTAGTHLAVTDGLTISGPGPGALTISGNASRRIFYVNTTDAVTISGVTLTSGRAGSGGVASQKGGAVAFVGADVTIQGVTISSSGATFGGGALFVQGGALTLVDSVVSGNGAGCSECPVGGGGILTTDATVEVTDSEISDNSVNGFQFYGYGGGLDVTRGSLTIARSTFDDNFVRGFAGALRVSDVEDVVIEASTFSRNVSYSRGAGAISLFRSNATIVSSTIAKNRSGGLGGGIAAHTGSLTLAHSTVTGNSAGAPSNPFGGGGGGLFLTAQSVTLDHTIVAENGIQTSYYEYGHGSDILGQGGAASVTVSHSMVESPPVGVTVTDGGGNVNGVDPELSPLADNGGPTETRAISEDSPAFDAGDPAFTPPPATDQRGLARVSSATVDIGAFEVQVDRSILPGGGSVTEGNAGTRVVNVKVRLSTAAGFPVSVDWATVDSVGEPVEGLDYVSASGTVTFAPGEVLKLVPITILGDTTEEPDEWVPVHFTNPTGATLEGYGLGFGVIRDDDPVPTVLPGGGAVTEGNAGVRVVNVKVKLSNPSSVPVTVDWATVDSVGEPAEGVDYESASGTVTFAPGEVLKIVPITILGDTTDEPDEFVPVQFTNPTNATVGGYGLGFGLIRDDD